MAKEKAPAKAKAQTENKEKPVKDTAKEAKKKTDGEPEVNDENEAGAGSDEPQEAGEKSAEAEAPEEKKEDDNTQYLRLMADFQNYKKRVEKEKSDIYAFANEKLIGEMLDVIDNFERALGRDDAAKDGFAEGMNMIFKQLTGVLEKAGLEEIKAQGQEFDPNFHNAVMTEETAEYESGMVTAVLQKGYMLNKRVLRPSMVKVAQ